MQTTEELANDIYKLVTDPVIPMSSDEMKLRIRQMISHHVHDFARIEKNIRDTSLPHELYERMSDLYVKYGMHHSHTVIL